MGGECWLPVTNCVGTARSLSLSGKHTCVCACVRAYVGVRARGRVCMYDVCACSPARPCHQWSQRARRVVQCTVASAGCYKTQAARQLPRIGNRMPLMMKTRGHRISCGEAGALVNTFLLSQSASLAPATVRCHLASGSGRQRQFAPLSSSETCYFYLKERSTANPEINLYFMPVVKMVHSSSRKCEADVTVSLTVAKDYLPSIRQRVGVGILVGRGLARKKWKAVFMLHKRFNRPRPFKYNSLLRYLKRKTKQKKQLGNNDLL